MPHQELFRKDGSRIPSVTEIVGFEKEGQIRQFSIQKYGEKRAQQKLEATRNIGNAFHELIATNQTENTSMRLSNMFGELMAWPLWGQGCILWQEKTLIDPKECFQGTFDLLWVIQNRLELLDWKTGSRINNDVVYQLIGYRELLGLNYNLWASQGRIVQVPAKRPHKVAEKLFDLTDKKLPKEFYRRVKKYNEFIKSN